MKLYLEIGPLREREFTGIPHVTASIAGQMLGDTENDVAFFFGSQLIGNKQIESILHRRDGEFLLWYAQRANTPMVPVNPQEKSVGIFPNVKTIRRAFAYEAQVFHDLSAILTPQFHNEDTIRYHAYTARQDLVTNDLTVCVSDATRDDVLRYLSPPRPDRVITIYPGHEWPAQIERAHQDAISSPQFAGAEMEPYVLVLGTIEPRKNIGVILDFIGKSKSILEEMRFVFVGRRGWGEQFESYLAKYDVLDAYERGKILFTGYVSEQAKYSLMKEAKLLVYPSLFEGFGLPVLEGMSLGTPVLTTRSSSIPEVGGEACHYFDPFSSGDFAKQFWRATLASKAARAALSERAIARSRSFKWSAFYKELCGALSTIVQEPAEK
jgi:glycosyltransferase involved in cell wall biosynthesis